MLQLQLDGRVHDSKRIARCMDRSVDFGSCLGGDFIVLIMEYGLAVVQCPSEAAW